VKHLGDLLYSHLLSLLFCDQFPLIPISAYGHATKGAAKEVKKESGAHSTMKSAKVL